MKVYLPYLLAELYCILPLVTRLKDSARHCTVLFGLIISLLGGVLHLSYPPTLDEGKLYCEVISLYEHYGLVLGDIVPTFAHVLHALEQPQPFPVAPHAAFLDELFEYVWVVCSQSRTCLSLLAPCLSNANDAPRLAKRLDHLLSLNYARFIEFVKWKWEQTPWKLPKTDSASCMIILKRELQQREEFHYNNHVFKVFDKIDDSVVLPAHLFSITGSVASKDVIKSGMRSLVYMELLVEQWPYFKHFIESGLSESKAQAAELPLSDDTIKMILKSLSGPDHGRDMARELATELIEFGPQLGLFDSLVHQKGYIEAANVAQPFADLVRCAVGTLFDYSPEAMNLSHAMGFHDFWKSKMPELYRQNYDDNYISIFISKLIPEIAAAAPAKSEILHPLHFIRHGQTNMGWLPRPKVLNSPL